MKLIGSLTSPFVRKIRIQLQEKEIPYEFLIENVWEQSTTIAEHNPLGKVPCLILDGGQTVFDSLVISGTLEYMMPTVPLLPTNPNMRALVRTMESLGQGLAQAAVDILLEKRFHEGEGVSQAWVGRQTQKIHNSLAWLAQTVCDLAAEANTISFSRLKAAEDKIRLLDGAIQFGRYHGWLCIVLS